MSNFKKGIFGSFLLIGESILNKLIGLLSTLILARVLLPEDFGIVAIAALTIGFFEILSETGSVQYLLRAKKIDDSIVNTSWTINIILRFILLIVIYFSSFWVINFYNDERVQPIMVALGILFFIQALQNPAVIYLKRNQEYSKIVKATLVGKVIAVVTAVSIALNFESYWALVAGQAANVIAILVGHYVIYPYRPKFELSNAKKQWTFSGWMIPQSILGYFRTQLDTFLASSLFGKAELGSYYTMKYLAFVPSAYLIMPMTETFLVEMRRASEDKGSFCILFNAALLITLLIAIPIATFLLSSHSAIVLIMLGDNWIEFSELLAAFGFLIPSAAIHGQCCKTLILFNKPNHILFFEIMTFIFIYSVLFFVGWDDLTVFTYTRVALEQIVTVSFLIYVSLKYTSVLFTLKLFASISVIVLACFISLYVLTSLPLLSNIIIFNLTIQAILFATIFLLVFGIAYYLFLFRFSEWAYIVSILRRISEPIINKFAKDK